jgi:hypothetical protein
VFAGTAVALPVDHHRQNAERRRPERTVLPNVCLVLLIVSLLAWRNGDYYAGGLDPVVIAKAAMGLVALVMSAYLLASSPTRYWVGLQTVGLCTAYLATALLGGMANGALFANLVLVVRVVMVLLTMLCLVMAAPMEVLIERVCGCLAGVGVVLGITGLPKLSQTGRLPGGVLPVNPNQLAILFGPFILYALWRMLNDRARSRDPLLFVFLLGLTWLTGSRTGLIALVVAIATIMLMAPRLPMPAALALVVAVPAMFYILYLSPFVSSYFGRGGTQNITTLNSRTIAWRAALSAHVGFWRHWFGGGLGVKTVPVTGTYWSAQVLDSSWLSAFVQVGVVGIALLGLWVVLTLAGAARAPKPYRAFLLAAALYAVINSLLVTGLLDAYVLFILILLPALASEAAGVQRGQRGHTPILAT